MKKEKIVRAWRDPDFRATLSEAELAALPSHPSGLPELADGELTAVLAGGVLSGGFAEPGPEPAPIPISDTRGTAVYSYGCKCICCV